MSVAKQFPNRQQREKRFVHNPVADLGGRVPPYGPKFSQFHVVFRKIWQNHMLAPPPPRRVLWFIHTCYLQCDLKGVHDHSKLFRSHNSSHNRMCECGHFVQCNPILNDKFTQ